MSADLLAAFGNQAISVSESSTSAPTYDKSKHTTGSGPSKPAPVKSQVPAPPELLWKKDAEGADVLFDASADDGDNDDDFGDFEDPEATIQPLQSLQLATPDTSNTDLVDVETLVASSSSLDTKRSPAGGANGFTGNPFGDLIDLGDVATTTTPRIVSTKQKIAPEEDWGTFEDVEPGTSNSKSITVPPSKPSGAFEPAVEATEEDDWEVFDDEPMPKDDKETKITPIQESQPPPEDTDEDDWDAFEDGPAMEIPITRQPAMNTDKSKAPPSAPPSTSIPSKPNERPTNIPPPSTLLELLPTLYQTLATQTLTSPNNTTAHRILQTYHATTRILSGRSHRWKRDPHLLSSTTIAPSGSKGMKLQSLRPTSTHTLKEDQDALEVISSWSQHSHVFRSTLLKAKIHLPTAPLSDKMVVKTVSGPGVLTAKEVCAVCGLRRNERVLGADGGVEDVFGEFWVEFWGHRDCFLFWEGVQGMLERR